MAQNKWKRFVAEQAAKRVRYNLPTWAEMQSLHRKASARLAKAKYGERIFCQAELAKDKFCRALKK